MTENQSLALNKRAHISAADLGAEFETCRRLKGLDEAIDQFTTWTPWAALIGPADAIVRRALREGRVADVHHLLTRRWTRPFVFRILSTLLLAGEILEPDALSRALSALARLPAQLISTPDFDKARLWHERVLIVLEAAVVHPGLYAEASKVLAKHYPNAATASGASIWWVDEVGDLLARARALAERFSGQAVPVESDLPGEQSLEIVPDADPLNPALQEARESIIKANRARDEFNTNRNRAIAQLRMWTARAGQRLTDPLNAEVVADLEVSPHQLSSRPRPSPPAQRRLARLHAADRLRADVSVDWIIAWLNPALDPNRAIETLAGLCEETGRSEPFAEVLVLLAATFETAPGGSSDRAGRMMACARLADRFDPDLARNLYDRALQVSDEADIEALSYLAALCGVATAGVSGTPDERRGLAETLAERAGAVQASLGDEIDDHMPWSELLSACAVLHPPTALAVVGRWRDDGFVRITDLMDGLLDPAARPALSSATRSVTARLADRIPVDDLTTADTVEQFCRQNITGGTLRHLDRASAALEELDPFLVVGVWARRTIAAKATLRTDAPAIEEAPCREAAPDPELATLAEIEAEIAAAPVSGRRRYLDFDGVAGRVRRHALRVPTLKAMAASFRQDRSFGEFLVRSLPAWTGYPPVKDWARTGLAAWIIDALPRLFGLSYRDTDHLAALLDLTGLDAPGQIDLVLAGIEQHGEALKPEMLISLAGLTAVLSTPERRTELLGVLNARLGAGLGRPAQCPMVGMNAPHDEDEALGRFLFALMGDVDRRQRWRAAHAVRGLARSGQDGVLAALVRRLGAMSEPVFARPELAFYGLGARQHLAIALHRIAFETPAALLPHLPAVAAAALADEPHVVIKAFLKAAALELVTHGPEVLDAATVTDLTRVNVSPVPAISARRVERWNGRRRREGERYNFDDTDTLPYWYASAAAVFDLGLPQFCEMAERWILDVWGFPVDQWKWVAEPRNARFESLDTSLTSHRHGSEPTVERVARYVELHAMFCVMGELLQTTPEVDDGYGQSFNDWLSNYLLTEDPFWLADLADPPPIEPRFWGPVPGDDAADTVWLTRPEASRFEAETIYGERLVVTGSWSRHAGDRREYVHVNSALVSPATAHALARALQTAREPMDYGLPGSRDDLAITEAGYELSGWLGESHRDPRADADDEARAGVDRIPFRPFDDIVQSFGLADDVMAHGWCGSGETGLVLEYGCWATDDDGVGSDGWRGYASRDFVRRVLQERDRSLILEVRINREVGSGYSPRRRRSRQLFILDQSLGLAPALIDRTGPGPYWVRALGLAEAVDTYGRWLIHHIAELDARRLTSNAPPGVQEELLEAVARFNDHMRDRRPY